MGKTRAIIKYDYKMLIQRIATWSVLAAATLITLLDSFPSAANLARLEFLSQPGYFIYRTMSQEGLILAFGLMFLLSNGFGTDQKTGAKSLFMAAPLHKGQYIGGKLLAGWLYALTIIALFLALNTAVYAVGNPVKSGLSQYLLPLGKTIIVSALPVSLFVSFCALAIPAMIDTRLFYIGSSTVFMLNAATVGTAGRMPFYLITAGDLIKLIWQHPKYPFHDPGSVAANLLFLVGCGLLAGLALLCKRKFWRAE